MNKYQIHKIHNSNSQTKVRIAPSPTGVLHIGTARTALFNYLFAKRYGGKFILRIEDTDVERSSKEYEKDILDSLEWLGLKWDEFYRQSERKEIYRKYLQQLLDSGKASWDDIIRFKCPKQGKIKFNDLIRGEVEFDLKLLGDFSLAKDLDSPLYNFAVVVDDQTMGISHVIRGEDHIPNTPKQILIQDALGFRQPQYAHIPLTLGPDKAKLSKRHGAVAISEYRKQGYLPEALINFMVLLGWNPGGGDEREIFSLKELEKEFSIEKINKSAAIFNIEKLDWFNAYYIRKKSPKELVKLILEGDFLRISNLKPQISNHYIENVVRLEQTRLKKLSEIGEMTEYFFKEPEYDKTLLQWKGKQDFQEIYHNLDELTKILRNIKDEDFSEARLRKEIMPFAEKHGVGNVLWPFRVALTGLRASPDPIEIAAVLGKNKVLERIKKAQNMLQC